MEKPPVDHNLYKGIDAFLNLSKVDWEWTNAQADDEHKKQSECT